MNLKKDTQKVMLTDGELQCYRVTQSYRRRYLANQLLSIHRIFWPRLLSKIDWSDSWWRFALQCLMLAFLWPGIVIWGLAEYLLFLLKAPALIVSTFLRPYNVRSPGEKSLVGIHNAFQPILKLPESAYIECVDQWIVILFGTRPGQEQTMRKYVEIEMGRQKSMGSAQVELGVQMRSKITVARESLSQDLGHYLEKL